MLTKRDYQISDWLAKLKAAQTNHVAEYFWEPNKKYPNIQARRRLNKIYANRYRDSRIPNIKKDRIHINMQYTYYTCNKKQIEHQLQLTNFMVELKKILKYDIPSHWWNTEYSIEDIKADMILRIYTEHYFFIESHNKSDKFDFQKYDKLYLRKRYDKFYKDLLGYVPKEKKFPKVIIITDKKLNFPMYTEVKFIQLKSDCSNIRDIFKE